MGRAAASAIWYRFRDGTTTPFAALDIASGKVTAKCKARHRHQGCLVLLRLIDREVPGDLDIDLVLDNYATHKHAEAKAWLAERPTYHLHCTPTYSSWLNQVEGWFGPLSEQAVKRGARHSVGALPEQIQAYMEGRNEFVKPFMWAATA